MMQGENDNEPRSAYEIVLDQSYDVLRQTFTDIKRDSCAVIASFQSRAVEIASYDYGELDAPQLLALLTDYETLLYPPERDQETQLQICAQILLDDVIGEHGIETGTQCAIEGFIAADRLRDVLGSER